MGRAIGLILDLLFPPRCAMCGGVTAIATGICDDCTETLNERFGGLPLCGNCADTEERCSCGGGGDFRCVCAIYYNGETRPVFERLKNDSDPAVAAQLAGMMAAVMQRSGANKGGFDCVTCVPAGERRIAEKGFDHAERLAVETAKRLGIPFIPAPVIQEENYRPQHTLGMDERLINAQRGYSAAKDGRISGRVLLIDDIITTGATLRRCAALLKDCGASEVVCLTAAVTPFDESRAKSQP